MAKRRDHRADRILAQLRQSGSVSLEDLMASLKASAPSIRRDLARLESQGLVRRTHGGVTLVEELLYEPFRFDVSFLNREQHFRREKRRIAAAAAEMIKEGETVGFTPGTTTTRVARNIRHRSKISVITNALNIAMELCNMPGLKTFVTGGNVRWAWSFSLAGQAAIDSLKNRYMDKLFLSATGIDAERGVTTNEADEAATFRAMAEQAKQVVLVGDSSKLGLVSPSLICPIKSVHILVTDTGATDETVEKFTRRGVEVIRV